MIFKVQRRHLAHSYFLVERIGNDVLSNVLVFNQRAVLYL
ncbi:hypothetical protein PAUR_a4536 [Pseudoalteromonas aurantia 208]|uniref:Uncharacterized protein n=1 Tax=Pseudoalteromonas aurantia 208 TaxID=1314867 RepID=A0ABR9EG16_9GAMM|nr:hypothetical protein [Pseudoalteromonas aurantia 208]